MTFSLFFKNSAIIFHFSCHFLMPEIKRDLERRRKRAKNMTLMMSCEINIFCPYKLQEEDWETDIKACLNNNASSWSSSSWLFSSSCYVLCVESAGCVYAVDSGASIHKYTSAVLQTSLLNLCSIHLKDNKEVTDSLRVCDKGEEEFSLDTKANNATKVQNTILTRTWRSPERE